MAKQPNYVLHAGDCLKVLAQKVKNGVPTLAVIDPPYNLGKNYTDHVDSRPKNEYLEWLGARVKATVSVLSPSGSILIAINDANVSELDIYCKNVLGLYPRRKICWYYTFGQHHSRSLTSSHITFLYYSLKAGSFTFNESDPKVRIPSARQLVYNDKRANSKGRLPDDVWILRPEQLVDGFDPLSDTWAFSRICGTFKAKVKASPNQMPVPMLERIIRLFSNPGETVIDSFNGTGSTGEAALRCGRKYIGIDISADCIKASEKRLSKLVATEDNTKQMELFNQTCQALRSSSGTTSHYRCRA